MSEFEFTDAVREAIPPLIAVAGPSGSGKTYTALRIASGMTDGDVYVIDTENKRAKLYAGENEGEFAFKHLALGPPFHPNRFVAAIEAAVRAGAGAIVLDSSSPEWEGLGGCQQIHDEAAKRFSGNKFAAWGVVTPLHQRFLDTLTHCPVPLIVTVRSKTSHEQVGKEIVKMGLAPIQRPGFEYEFPVWIDMNPQHVGTVARSCWRPIQDQAIEYPNEELGASIAEWFGGGEPQDKPDPKKWTAPEALPFDGEMKGSPGPGKDRDRADRIALVKQLRQNHPNDERLKDPKLREKSLDELLALQSKLEAE